MVFARSAAGRELTFGVSGKLIMNAVVIYDHQTETLWSQFLARAVEGPLAGTSLELLPAQLTTWETWSDLHPDTLALDKRGLRGDTSSYDSYSGYYDTGQAGILGETNRDERLTRKEFVVGLANDRAQKAYPFRYLNEAPVVNDAFDDAAIVVAFDPRSAATAVFSREVEGRTLTFQAVEGRGDGRALMRDPETGTTWGRTTGQALEGPLAGQRLRQVPSFASFWFAWTDFYPASELFEP